MAAVKSPWPLLVFLGFLLQGMPPAAAEPPDSALVIPENIEPSKSGSLQDQVTQPSEIPPVDDEAISELRHAVRLDPSYADAHLALGVALYTAGDLSGGIAELREAVRLKPDHANARYHLAIALLKQRDAMVLAEKNRAAMSGEPVLAEAYLDVAKAYLAAGNMPAAIAELREALRLRPGFSKARADLAFALFNIGDMDGAIEEYRAVIRLQPDLAQAHAGLATALMAKHDWPAARGELQEAIRLQPDFVQAYYSLGVVRYTLGDIPGAIDAYRQALKLKTDYAEAHYNLGLLLKLNNQDAEAVEELQAAALAGLPKAQYFLGTAYASGGGVEKNLAQAITWWSRAGEQGMSQAKESLAQLRRIALLDRKQSPDESRAVAQAFLELRSRMWRDFPDLQASGSDDSVGAALVRRGRVQEAIPVLIREGHMLSEPAQAQLQALYERGAEGQLAPHDPGILAYFKTAAAEGLPRPRLALARIYARGFGVPADLGKAIGLLKGNPDEEAQRMLRELSAGQPEAQQATRAIPPASTISP